MDFMIFIHMNGTRPLNCMSRSRREIPRSSFISFDLTYARSNPSDGPLRHLYIRRCCRDLLKVKHMSPCPCNRRHHSVKDRQQKNTLFVSLPSMSCPNFQKNLAGSPGLFEEKVLNCKRANIISSQIIHRERPESWRRQNTQCYLVAHV